MSPRVLCLQLWLLDHAATMLLMLLLLLLLLLEVLPLMLALPKSRP